MLRPSEEYKFLKNVNNIDDIAHYELYEKYIIQNLKGFNKRTEIESTDQESTIVLLNGGYPIPGMIYTFIYDEPDKIELSDGDKGFIDVVPLVFCMNTTRGSFKGINMNMLPYDIRLKFLDSFYDNFKDFFKDVEIKTENDKLALNTRFIELIKSGKGQRMIKLFNIRWNADFNFGYRSYKIDKIKKFRMIEYNEWLYIPFLTPKEAFRKMSFNEIHKLYKYRQK